MVRLQDYNIIVTFHPPEKWRAEEEIADRLKDAGLDMEDLQESSVQGLVLVRTREEGRSAVKRIRGLAFRFPELFRYTHHWTPIERWASSSENSMVEAVKFFAQRIEEGDRWRLDLEKRQYQAGSTSDLVKMLTEPIDKGTVDLDSPERMLKIEIIGDFAGFSLVSEEEVLDINLVRMQRGLAKII